MPKFAASCKFEGRFPGSKTNHAFRSPLPVGMAAEIARIPVESFRKTMVETYPELPPDRVPKLRKLVITITLP